mgnify:CR=1 FL=1
MTNPALLGLLLGISLVLVGTSFLPRPVRVPSDSLLAVVRRHLAGLDRVPFPGPCHGAQCGGRAGGTGP